MLKLIKKWRFDRSWERQEKALREDRRFADLLLMDGYDQIAERVPLAGDTWIEEDYYGAGVFTEKLRPLPTQRRRIVRWTGKRQLALQ